jgi:dienelactone hydrolase
MSQRPLGDTPCAVASRITGDVLILVGEHDHFVTADQGEKYKASLTHARSVTMVVFDDTSGGAEHCQVGAPSLWQAVFFDWLATKYPPARLTPTAQRSAKT